MIALQILSDIHLEAFEGYNNFEITPRASRLALLGDIGCFGKDFEEYTDFLLARLRQFKIVFLVLGNHEPYHSSWAEVKTLAKDFQKGLEAQKEYGENLGDFVLLDQTRFDIDEGEDRITVLGCTLFSKVPSESHDAVSFGLNDFFYIENWDVKKHNEEHQRDVQWLNTQVQALEGSGRKVVVLTHFNPTRDTRAQDPRHRNSSITSGFATNLQKEPVWQSKSVKLWAFGHTHFNCDFTDGHGKRIYANQRGPFFGQSTGFDVSAVVNL
ncbi:putative Metallo-dependent phosphatase-like protein [Seiridium cardinale]|uniref:Metallo-dependent phosphatase-like protein n=1 Tax=Seiridium cardinale TaxID=138064 RepID=A0ABR2Y7T7_9PEZI